MSIPAKVIIKPLENDSLGIRYLSAKVGDRSFQVVAERRYSRPHRHLPGVIVHDVSVFEAGKLVKSFEVSSRLMGSIKEEIVELVK